MQTRPAAITAEMASSTTAAVFSGMAVLAHGALRVPGQTASHGRRVLVVHLTGKWHLVQMVWHAATAALELSPHRCETRALHVLRGICGLSASVAGVPAASSPTQTIHSVCLACLGLQESAARVCSARTEPSLTGLTAPVCRAALGTRACWACANVAGRLSSRAPIELFARAARKTATALLDWIA